MRVSSLVPKGQRCHADKCCRFGTLSSVLGDGQLASVSSSCVRSAFHSDAALTTQTGQARKRSLRIPIQKRRLSGMELLAMLNTDSLA
jgi:hypothetical protein